MNENCTPTKKTDGVLEYSCVLDRGLRGYLVNMVSFPADFEVLGRPEVADIRQVVEYKFSEAVRLGKKLSILDVGCGRGDFLVDVFNHLQQVFPKNVVRDHLDLTGISLHDLRDRPSEKRSNDVRVDLENVHARYIVDDANTALKGLQEKFDIVVSNCALMYIEPAKLRHRLIQTIYHALTPGGVANLHNVRFIDLERLDEIRNPFSLEKAIARSLDGQYKDQGLRVHVSPDDVLMLKNDRDFTLPFTYDTAGEVIPKKDS